MAGRTARRGQGVAVPAPAGPLAALLDVDDVDGDGQVGSTSPGEQLGDGRGWVVVGAGALVVGGADVFGAVDVVALLDGVDGAWVDGASVVGGCEVDGAAVVVGAGNLIICFVASGSAGLPDR